MYFEACFFLQTVCSNTILVNHQVGGILDTNTSIHFVFSVNVQQTVLFFQRGLPAYPVSPPISPISQRSDNFTIIQGMNQV